MPAQTLKQLNYFKLVRAYKESNLKGFVQMWKKLFGARPLPEIEFIEQIKEKAAKMKQAHLEDLTSGIVGAENLGDVRKFKVGYFVLFTALYRDLNKEIKEQEFIGKIKSVNTANKIVNLTTDELYNRFGGRIMPQLRAHIADPQHQYIDYAYFKDIEKVGVTIKDVELPRPKLKEIQGIIKRAFAS